MPELQTNAKDEGIAQALSALLEEYQGGTTLSFIVTKVGETRNGRVYGNDTTHVLIWAGFQYRALVGRSQRMLQKRLDKGGVVRELAKRAFQENPETLAEDSCAAIQEMQEWFDRVMRQGITEGDSFSSSTSSFWEPLVIRSHQVPGCRVYCGPARPDKENAPVPGTVYIQGVKLGEKTLAPAENGEWTPKSSPKTILKRILKEELPIGRYVQYRLDPERCRDLKVGKAASASAMDDGIPIDPESLRSLFKIAP